MPADGPVPGALDEVRRLAGPDARIASVVPLRGGQHVAAWRVDTDEPASTVVVRRFPVEDRSSAHEQRVLAALDGLGDRAPRVLAVDLDGRWSEHPTTVLSWIEGLADISPAEPDGWAAQLGEALAAIHATPAPAGLSTVLDEPCGSRDRLSGPLAPMLRERWTEIAGAPCVLAHTDFWSGNTIWRGARLAGVVDWSGALRGPRGFDLAWCRLDLFLLFGDLEAADVFLTAYQRSAGLTIEDPQLWDAWALARSHDDVARWDINYAELGRPDLDGDELRRRHADMTALTAL